MNRTTTAPGRPATGGFRNPITLMLAALCMIGSLQAATPEKNIETGIKGTVLWGPVMPGPARVGQSDEAPLQASFLVLDSGQKVASFQSDDEGHFEVSLPPGDYTIVPDESKRKLFPGGQKKVVTVPEDGFAQITLRFDTGMR